MGYDYLPKKFLHVYDVMGTTRVKLYDDWGNTYTFADIEILESYTWQGSPIFNKENHVLISHQEFLSSYIHETTELGMGIDEGFRNNKGPNMPHQPQNKNVRIEQIKEKVP